MSLNCVTFIIWGPSACDLVVSVCCVPFQISHMFRCARIQGLDTSEGLLLFGKEHFYVIDGFTLLKTREIKDIDTLPPG